MSDRTKIARIAASIEATMVHNKLARAGGLKLTTAQPAVAQRLPPASRRRTPSMPRVTLDTKPTPERAAKAPGGVEQATGTRAHRVRSTMDVVAERLTEEELCAAKCFVAHYLTAEASRRQSITTDFSGVPGRRSTARLGGVKDAAREAFTAMERARAQMDRSFWEILEKLAVGVRREIDGTPWTLEEIGREFLPKPYANADANRGVGLGMLKGALWRAREFYHRERALAKCA